MKRFAKVCYVVVNLPKRLKRKTYVFCGNAVYITIAVTIAKRIHLFPFRTQKLSFLTPKVLALKRREDR